MVQQLRAAYLASGSSLANLAKELDGVLTAQGITEVFGERANPTSEQTLAIIDFLKDQRMSTPVFEPKPDRPPRVEHPDQPLTLAKAQERIDMLNAELRQLRGAPSPTTTTGTPKPATATPTGSTSFADIGSNPMIVRPETPVTALDHLRVALNQASSQEEKHALYQKIKALEAEQSGPRPRARLRGA